MNPWTRRKMCKGIDKKMNVTFEVGVAQEDS